MFLLENSSGESMALEIIGEILTKALSTYSVDVFISFMIFRMPSTVAFARNLYESQQLVDNFCGKLSTVLSYNFFVKCLIIQKPHDSKILKHGLKQRTRYSECITTLKFLTYSLFERMKCPKNVNVG